MLRPCAPQPRRCGASLPLQNEPLVAIVAVHTAEITRCLKFAVTVYSTAGLFGPAGADLLGGDLGAGGALGGRRRLAGGRARDLAHWAVRALNEVMCLSSLVSVFVLIGHLEVYRVAAARTTFSRRWAPASAMTGQLLTCALLRLV